MLNACIYVSIWYFHLKQQKKTLLKNPVEKFRVQKLWSNTSFFCLSPKSQLIRSLTLTWNPENMVETKAGWNLLPFLMVAPASGKSFVKNFGVCRGILETSPHLLRFFSLRFFDFRSFGIHLNSLHGFRKHHILHVLSRVAVEKMEFDGWRQAIKKQVACRMWHTYLVNMWRG